MSKYSMMLLAEEKDLSKNYTELLIAIYEKAINDYRMKDDATYSDKMGAKRFLKSEYAEDLLSNITDAMRAKDILLVLEKIEERQKRCERLGETEKILSQYKIDFFTHFLLSGNDNQ